VGGGVSGTPHFGRRPPVFGAAPIWAGGGSRALVREALEAGIAPTAMLQTVIAYAQPGAPSQPTGVPTPSGCRGQSSLLLRHPVVGLRSRIGGLLHRTPSYKATDPNRHWRSIKYISTYFLIFFPGIRTSPLRPAMHQTYWKC